MPLHLKTANAKQKELDVPFDSEIIHLVYKPRKFNPGRRQQLLDQQSSPEEVYKFLADILDEWDIFDEKDKPVPLTVKGMRDAEVPDEVLNAIVMGILEDMNPNQTATRTAEST